MSAASDNTEELIEKLSLELNRARQAQTRQKFPKLSAAHQRWSIRNNKQSRRRIL